jgi:ABC-type transporter Mla subunit MlaD
MGRPSGSQWQPLGWDTDPVPGDPEVISQEARLLASVADQINGQIAALRKISSDQTNFGRTADAIRSSASDLVGTLQVVGERYQRVSSALTGWVGELEQAQSMSIRALDQAEAPYAQLNHVVALPCSAPRARSTRPRRC